MIIQRTARSKYSVVMWLVVALVVFGVSVGAGYLAGTWQGEKMLVVENKQGLYTPETSDKGMEEYLKYTGLSERVEQVKLTYESARLESYAYTRELPDGTLDVMMDLKVEDKVVNVWLYYNPELFEYMLATPERIQGDVLAGVCLALNPGTMPTCMEQAFGYIEWAKESGLPAVIQPVSPQSWWRRLVPQAYAGCSGTIPCGADKTVCICSISGAICSASGTSCGPGKGTCSCQTTCDESQNTLNCSSLTTQQLCTTQGDLSSCSNKCSASRPDGDYCSWSNTDGPTATPTPVVLSCGTGGCEAGKGETCSTCPSDCGTCTSYWRVSGEIRNATNGLQSGVTVTVKWPDNSTQTYSSKSTPASDLGVYVVTKNAANVSSSGYFEATAGDAYRVNNTTNAVNKGCSLINNDKTYRCPMDIGFNQPDPPPKWLHFKAYVAPTATPTPTLAPPTCSKNSWPTSITAAGSGTFNVTGNDPDSVAGATTPSVEYYFTKQLNNYCISSPSTGNAVDGKWQKLGTTDSGDLSGSRTLNNATLNLPAGTYMMTANLRDNDNQFSTGNPGTPAGCGNTPNNCNGTFTIGSTCSKPTIQSTSINCDGTYKVAYVDYNPVSTCSVYEIQKSTNSSFTSYVELYTDTNTDNNDYYTIPSSEGLTKSIKHYVRIRCKTKTASATCTMPTDWSDYKEVAACDPAPSCALSMSGLSLNPSATGTMTANVTAESGGTVGRVDFSSSSTARVTVNPASDTTRTDNFTTTAKAVGSAGQTATITARGFINETERCSTTANVTIVSTPVCTGGTTPPASNYTVCSGDNTGLSANTAWSNVSGSSACSTPSGSAPKCQWYCNSGTTWNGSICEVVDPVTCSISPSSTVLNMGGAVTLNLSTTGLGTNPTSTWKKDNARIATLTGSGSSRVATACSSCNTGSTNLDSGVTVAVSGAGKTCNATADIDVAPASGQPCTVSLTPTSATIDAGQTRSFTGTTNAPSGSTYQWVAETPSVLSYVSHTGLNATFMGVSAGPSALRVRLRVNPPASSNLTTCEATANVRVDSTVVTVGCNEVCNGSTTVCQSGLTCAELGATDRCRNAACSSVTTCNCPPGTPSCDMTLTPNTWSPAAGATRNYTATVSNVTNGALNNVTFSTANSGVVNISGSCNSASCTKQATAVASGTTTITATARVANTDGVCSASKTITVAGSPPPSDLACNQTCTQNSECASGYCHTLASGAKVCRNSACSSRSNCTCIDPCTLTLDPTSLNLNVGETKGIVGTITNQPSNATIRWSLDEAVANIGLNPGLNPQLTGEVGGSATLTGQVRVGSTVYCSATASINVNDNPTQVGCNQVCNGSSIVCANANHTCYDHDGNGTTTCRRAACDWDNNCDCQPTVVNACNGSCQGDLGDTGVARVCGSGMTCVSGQCRDAGCPTNASCVCQPPVCEMELVPAAAEVVKYDPPTAESRQNFVANATVSYGTLDTITFTKSNNNVNWSGVGTANSRRVTTHSGSITVDDPSTPVPQIENRTVITAQATATGPGGTVACVEDPSDPLSQAPTAYVDVVPPPCEVPSGVVIPAASDVCLSSGAEGRQFTINWNMTNAALEAGVREYQVRVVRTQPGSATKNYPVAPVSPALVPLKTLTVDDVGIGAFEVQVRVSEADPTVCAPINDATGWSTPVSTTKNRADIPVKVVLDNNWLCDADTDQSSISDLETNYQSDHNQNAFDLPRPEQQAVNDAGPGLFEFKSQAWRCGNYNQSMHVTSGPWWYTCSSFDGGKTAIKNVNRRSDGDRDVFDANLATPEVDPVVFYASNTIKPWYQIYGGDIYSDGEIDQHKPIWGDPGTNYDTTVRLEDALSDSAGLITAFGGFPQLDTVTRQDKNWRVESEFDDTYRKEDYAYFWRLWQMPQTGAQDDGLAGETKSPEQLLDTTTQNLQLSETTKVLFANGNLNVSAGSFGTNSVVVFVKGNLTISGDVMVEDGGYVAFIVDGNISIEPSVELVEGVFIADGRIEVQTNTPDPVLVGSDVQFVGEGIFVGWAGVGLNRDLGEDTDGGGPDQGNNDMPAEKFVYRPDLVLNAPEEFLSTQVRMEERAPRDLYVEGYVPPTPTPEIVVEGELIKNGDMSQGSISKTDWLLSGKETQREWVADPNVAVIKEKVKKFNPSLTQEGFSLTKNVNYQLMFNAKSSSNISTLRVKVIKGKTVILNKLMTLSDLTNGISGDYQFTPNVSGKSKIQFIFSNTGDVQTYYLDNVSLKATE